MFAVVTRKRPEFVGRAPHVREGCVIQCRRAPVRSSQSRWCVLNILSYWAAVFKKWISSNYPWVTIDPMCSRPTLAGRTGRPDQIPLLLPRNDPKTNPNPIQTMHFRRFIPLARRLDPPFDLGPKSQDAAARPRRAPRTLPARRRRYSPPPSTPSELQLPAFHGASHGRGRLASSAGRSAATGRH